MARRPCRAEDFYRYGTTHVVFEPLDFIARLAALVPKPRVNLTRSHGEFAPNSAWRSQGRTPARRDRHARGDAVKTVSQHHAAMSWAQRFKREFRIEIEICQHSGGPVLQIHRESRRSNAGGIRETLVTDRPG